MRVTKFGHSCLTIEDTEVSVLIDPGNFSESFTQQILSTLHKLDFILITHLHQDHMHIPLIQAIQKKYPNAKVIAPLDAVQELSKEGIKAQTIGGSLISTVDAPHEKMFTDAPMASNLAFTVHAMITHPGDSFHVTKTAPILALPIAAPWGSTVEAVKLALSLKPKVIIPIHDAMMKDEVMSGFLYPYLAKVFKENDIDFKSVVNGEPIEV